MNRNVFAVYDKKAGEHFGLCVWPNAELFKRSIQVYVNDPTFKNNLFSSHSSDFELYALGSLDLRTGDLTGSRVFICNASDLKGDVSE